MITIRMQFGQESFQQDQMVYLWMLDRNPRVPIYVGESETSLADRSGLHIRAFGGEFRSGAQVATLITNRGYPTTGYIVAGESIPQELLDDVIAENLGRDAERPQQMARRALERRLYELLTEQSHPELHRAQNCAWTAECGTEFLQTFIEDALNCE